MGYRRGSYPAIQKPLRGRIHTRESRVRLTNDAGEEGWGEAAPLMYITKETGSEMAATLREAAPHTGKRGG